MCINPHLELQDQMLIQSSKQLHKKRKKLSRKLMKSKMKLQN